MAAFKFYNVEQRYLGTLFLPFTVNELTVDSEVRNTESYSSIRKTSENHNYKIYDTLRIQLLNRLRLKFSHLKQRRFGQNCADKINPLVNVMFLFP